MPLLVTGAVTRAQSVCVGGFGVSHQLVLLMSTCPSVSPAEVLGGFGAFCDAAREGLGCPHGQLGIPLSQTYHLLSSPRQFHYSSSLPCFRKLVTKNNNNNPFTKVVMGLKDGTNLDICVQSTHRFDPEAPQALGLRFWILCSLLCLLWHRCCYVLINIIFWYVVSLKDRCSPHYHSFSIYFWLLSYTLSSSWTLSYFTRFQQFFRWRLCWIYTLTWRRINLQSRECYCVSIPIFWEF